MQNNTKQLILIFSPFFYRQNEKKTVVEIVNCYFFCSGFRPRVYLQTTHIAI